MHKSFPGSSWNGWRDLKSLHPAQIAVTSPYQSLQTSLCCQLCFSWHNSQFPISVKMSWVGTDQNLNCLNYLGFWMKQARDGQWSSSSSRSKESITLGRRALMRNWCWVRVCSPISCHCCNWMRVAMDSPGCPASASELGLHVSGCLPGYTKCSSPFSPLRINKSCGTLLKHCWQHQNSGW